ncbi:MAG TPA: hypothetical protein VHT30_03910 [Acidimicrobiales bacterium]|jgi:hypothetical protein|nr:hypothetical protein [Acidimicrobiales bacterium]
MSDALIASWSRAEENLYTPLLADPQAYEQVVHLVGALANYLREHVSDVAGLAAASERGTGLVADVLPEAALPWIPLADAVAAACAIRYREVRVITAQAHRASALRGAAEAGETWVRIVDPNSAIAARVAPALLVHVRSGMAIACATELDPETGGARFTSSPVMVDPTTGDVLGPLETVGPPRSSASPEGRDADVVDLQHQIELDADRRIG